MGNDIWSEKRGKVDEVLIEVDDTSYTATTVGERRPDTPSWAAVGSRLDERVLARGVSVVVYPERDGFS